MDNFAEAIREYQKNAEMADKERASSPKSPPAWLGAEVPRGYSDVTAEIDTKQCDVLNANDEASILKVLFAGGKPDALKEASSSTGGGQKDWVESGADDQLLLFTPFHSVIKLHTIQLTSLPPADDPDAPMRPATIHLYTNYPHNLDFSEADDTEPQQVVTLTERDWNAQGTANVALRYVKFQRISSLVIYVTRGDGDGRTVRIDRVRLFGEAGEKHKLGTLKAVDDDHNE